MGDDLLNIRMDFGSVRDSRGWNQFWPFFLTLLDNPEGVSRGGHLNRDIAKEWAANWHKREHTHGVTCQEYGYQGSPIEGRHFTTERYLELEKQVMDLGFSPVRILSDIPEQQPRVFATTSALRRVGTLKYGISIPVWEAVPTNYYSSGQLSKALLGMIREGGNDLVLGVHLQPGRWSMASFAGTCLVGQPLPRGTRSKLVFVEESREDSDFGKQKHYLVEEDDVWDGEESGCWKSHGGERVDIFLPQFEHGFRRRPGGSLEQPDWQNRWRDGVPRMCNGLNGWRRMAVCCFETTLMDDYAGMGLTEQDARNVATEALKIAREEFGTTVITFGQGLPYGPGWPT